MMSDTLIRAQRLTIQSGTRYLLHNIDWEVKRGEHWLVFGMNGSGKTTLLSAVAGFKPLSSGYLEVLGEQYCEKNIFALRRRVGWVSSSFFDLYYEHEPALEIVLSGLSGTFGVRAHISDKDVRMAKALLRELGLEDKINHPYCLMSKGERQNVLIARALLTRPDILVLDEPSTGLDIYAREHMLNIVRSLVAQEKTTVIYVTHYPEEIQPFMNKTLLMRNGQVFSKGNTNSMLTSDVLSEFMGEKIEVEWNLDPHTIKMKVEAPEQLPVVYL